MIIMKQTKITIAFCAMLTIHYFPELFDIIWVLDECVKKKDWCCQKREKGYM